MANKIWMLAALETDYLVIKAPNRYGGQFKSTARWYYVTLPLLFATLTLLFCSCNDTEQNIVQSTDTSRIHLSSTQNLDTLSKGNVDTAIPTALTIDTLPKVLPGKMTLVSSGQIAPSTAIKIGGCKFDLVMSNNDTAYLATMDRKFQTPKGYRVGTNFSELSKDAQENLIKELGWGFYYKLPSGWALGFCEGKSCTENLPTNSSRVRWIFKRH